MASTSPPPQPPVSSGPPDPGATNPDPLPPGFERGLKAMTCSVCQRSYEATYQVEDDICVYCQAIERIKQRLVPVHTEAEQALFTARLEDYRLEQAVGTGSTAVIFRAIRHQDGKTVAIKMLHPALVAEPASRRRFARQARVLELLQHPHVVTLFEPGSATWESVQDLLPLLPDEPRRLWHDSTFGTFFLVTEYCPHGSLYELLQRHYRQGLPVSLACQLMGETLEGLAYAHQLDFHHRDIKPSNLLLSHPESGVKIADFGLVTSEFRAEFKSISSPSSGLGTLNFLVYPQTHTVTDDVWGLGATFFYLLTCRFPRELQAELTDTENYQHAPIQSVESLRPELPEPLCAVINRALKTDAGDRYATAVEMLAALRQTGLT